MGVAATFGAVFGRLERDALPTVSLPSLLARACAEVLQVDCAGISLFTSAGLRVPIGTSHDDADHVEQLQFTVGQGPGYQARDTTRTVRADETMLLANWPAFHRQLVTKTPIRSLTACPMSPPMTTLGTVDLYSRTAVHRAPFDDAEVDEVVTAVSMMLLDSLVIPTAGEFPPTPPRWITLALQNRHEVVVAMGMLNAALDLNGTEALAMLRGYAHTADLSLQQTAHRLAHHTLALSELDTGPRRPPD